MNPNKKGVGMKNTVRDIGNIDINTHIQSTSFLSALQQGLIPSDCSYEREVSHHLIC